MLVRIFVAIYLWVRVCFYLFIYLFLLSALIWVRQYSTVRLKRSLNIEEHQLAEPFIADHPFLWLLRHDTTGMWIFLGHLVEPLSIHDYPEITPSHHVDEL